MEDVLDVYARPYDPKRPVVCFDEKTKQLLESPNGSIPVAPGKPERQDHHYKRNGTRNIFCWVEPLAGKRHVCATARRTSLDFAEQIKELVDVHYPDAEQVVLVLDNLNTHKPSALYERFEPAEARRIVRKIQWHYTPEHGSWLNMAELELSVLSRQCINRRIANEQILNKELASWKSRRNSAQITIDWHFRTEDARIKLKRLYPITTYN